MARAVSIHPDSLKEQCRSLARPVPHEALPVLGGYLELLMQWNRVMNLVGTRTWKDTLHTLVADSFYLADFLDGLALPPLPEMWDLGAGAGLPALPLRMVWHKGRCTLVEAREKRAMFLSTVLARHPLPQTFVFRGRVEDFLACATAPADVVTSRAFLPWPQVLTLVGRHLAPGGRIICLALVPPPHDPPTGWQVESVYPYITGGRQGWFWSLCKDPSTLPYNP